MQQGSSTDSVALVTGGGSGIGAETVRRLAQRGVRTVVADLDFESARRVSAEAGASARSVAIRCDVVDPEEVRQAAAAAAELGRWDVLVCCAGWPGEAARLEVVPLDQWDRVFAINTMGVVHATREAATRMRPLGRGSIVHVASIAGLTGSRGQVAYSGAKAAVLGITIGRLRRS